MRTVAPVSMAARGIGRSCRYDRAHDGLNERRRESCPPNPVQRPGAGAGRNGGRQPGDRRTAYGARRFAIGARGARALQRAGPGPIFGRKTRSFLFIRHRPGHGDGRLSPGARRPAGTRRPLGHRLHRQPGDRSAQAWSASTARRLAIGHDHRRAVDRTGQGAPDTTARGATRRRGRVESDRRGLRACGPAADGVGARRACPAGRHRGACGLAGLAGRPHRTIRPPDGTGQGGGAGRSFFPERFIRATPGTWRWPQWPPNN